MRRTAHSDSRRSASTTPKNASRASTPGRRHTTSTHIRISLVGRATQRCSIPPLCFIPAPQCARPAMPDAIAPASLEAVSWPGPIQGSEALLHGGERWHPRALQSTTRRSSGPQAGKPPILFRAVFFLQRKRVDPERKLGPAYEALNVASASAEPDRTRGIHRHVA
jgi:hypothetical protein